MHRFFFAFACAGFILDRISKWYAQSLPAPEAAFSLGPIHFGYYLNPALFFFPAWQWIPWLALTVLIALAMFLIVRTQTQHITPDAWPMISIFLGGTSNVFDRFAYGGVIDYIAIFGLATINIADILIFVGLAMLIGKGFFRENTLDSG